MTTKKKIESNCTIRSITFPDFLPLSRCSSHSTRKCSLSRHKAAAPMKTIQENAHSMMSSDHARDEMGTNRTNTTAERRTSKTPKQPNAIILRKHATNRSSFVNKFIIKRPRSFFIVSFSLFTFHFSLFINYRPITRLGSHNDNCGIKVINKSTTKIPRR